MNHIEQLTKLQETIQHNQEEINLFKPKLILTNVSFNDDDREDDNAVNDDPLLMKKNNGEFI